MNARIHSLIEFDPDTACALDRLHAEWLLAESVAEWHGYTGETVTAVEAASDAYVDALAAARNGYAIETVHMRACTSQDLADMDATLAELRDLEAPFGGVK